jgi:glycosyltransferase involved in cell wall biosynthesis
MKKNNSIVYIFSYPEGGIGTHIIDICKSKIAKKYNIILISNFKKKDKKFSSFLLENSDNIELFDLNIDKNPKINDIFNILRIYLFLKNRDDILIIHGHGAKGGLYSRIVGKLLNKKIIYTPHGGSLHLNYGKIKNFIFKLVEKKLYKFTDKIIFESNYSSKKFEQNIIKDYRKISIVNYNGIEILRCLNNKNYRNEKYFLIDSYGTLRKLKGHDILIKAIYKLLLTNPNLNIKVRIFGDGEEKYNLNKLIKYYNLENIVFLKDYVPEIIPYLKECDLVVHPSRIESLPYTILEAMNLCKPVIASKIGGVPEVIIDNYNGFLFEKENEDDLANKIRFILQSKNLQYIIYNAKNTIIKKFNKTRMIKNLQKIYQEI